MSGQVQELCLRKHVYTGARPDGGAISSDWDLCAWECVCVCTKALGALSQVKVDVFAQEGDSAFSSFLAFCVSFKVSVACWKVPS